MEQRSFFSLD
jgi:hypothetical protein